MTEINCIDNTMRSIYEVLYLPNDKLVKSGSYPKSTFQPIVPDSMGELLKSVLCTERLKKIIE